MIEDCGILSPIKNQIAITISVNSVGGERVEVED